MAVRPGVKLGVFVDTRNILALSANGLDSDQSVLNMYYTEYIKFE